MRSHGLPEHYEMSVFADGKRSLHILCLKRIMLGEKLSNGQDYTPRTQPDHVGRPLFWKGST